MRVAKKTRNEQQVSGKLETSHKSDSVQVRHGVFLEALLDVERKQQKQDMDGWLSELDEAALAFAKSPVYSNLVRYKKLVQRILAELVKDTYRVNAKTGFDRYGGRRLYQTVTSVNQRLEELTKAVVSKHRPVLNLVEKLDEIRGLLCDLYR